MTKIKKVILPVFNNTMFIVGVFNLANLIINEFTVGGSNKVQMLINLFIIVCSGMIMLGTTED